MQFNAWKATTETHSHAWRLPYLCGLDQISIKMSTDDVVFRVVHAPLTVSHDATKRTGLSLVKSL